MIFFSRFFIHDLLDFAIFCTRCKKKKTMERNPSEKKKRKSKKTMEKREKKKEKKKNDGMIKQRK